MIKKTVLKEKVKAFIQFILNPRLVLCYLIAWFITNGWSYVLFGLGTWLKNKWMIGIGGAYLTFLWFPISPEKIVTLSITIVLLRLLFPNDEKTLGKIRAAYDKLKALIGKKETIRKKNKKKRNAMNDSEVKRKSSIAAQSFISSELYKDSDNIMLYIPLGKETDTSDIIKKAYSDCKKVIFPVTDKLSGEITPYCADSDTLFEKGAFSVSEPQKTDTFDACEIDVIIIPGIAFDKKGSRIGFGKGCYDKFLKNTPAVKVGFCYEWQMVRAIATDEYDVLMDYIITEKRIINCSKGRNEKNEKKD